MTSEQIHIGNMSHETAIGILKLMLEAMETYDGISPTPARINAIKMAIEALEQEPTTKNDLGVDKLLAGCEKMSFEIEIFNKPLRVVALDAVKNIVKGLPSVTPQELRWIPVSERLPENKTYVLVTIGIPGRQPHARSGWYQDGFFHNDNGDCWRATDIEVKAWMPLPEPYKAESEE